MQPPGGRAELVAPAGFALLAAFLWACYYFLVLGAGTTAPSALLAGPFVAGAVGFLGYAAARGELGAVARMFRDPTGYIRGAALGGTQVVILAATYLAGAIDTSLLSLVGDVVATPVFLLLVYGEGAARFRSPIFVGGLLVSTAGATLVIAGGGSAEPLTGWAWVAVPVVPVLVAFYFLYSAKTTRTAPISAVVGQATVVAAILTVLAAPLVPGGFAGLVPPNGYDALLVVAIGLTSFFAGPLLYFVAIQRAGLVLPVVLMVAIPIFALALEVALVGFVPPILALLGLPIALVGALAALRGPHEPWTPAYPDAAPGGK